MGVAQRRALQEAMRDEFEQAFLFCLALMHCDNVRGGRAAAVAAGGAQAEKSQPGAAAQAGDPLQDPHRHAAARRSSGGRASNGANGAGEAEPKALHFVRGHFKDYSVKGLFGKYKKVYWWDSQVRGEVMWGRGG